MNDTTITCPDLDTTKAEAFASLAKGILNGDADAFHSAMRKVDGFAPLWEAFVADPKGQGDRLDAWIDMMMTLADRLRART